MTTIKKKSGVIRNSECVFVPYEDHGVKLYKTKRDAQRVLQRQELAHKHGIGPAVLGGVKEYAICPPGCKKTRVMYGYKTELVLVLDHIRKESIKLEKKMARIFKTGHSYMDMHDGNYGVLNGKVVAIDFGDMTFS